ncbi:hypothetical protein HanHA300_Chr13g0483081 [Helianthus annuus]|nr:hypothetical protein HanHA300_Chr13g0483081 [Helianthus annuus]KAJ0497797.1 hypothetical protein HanHA89_Chr13g0515221 [Helianthus annuus]KAJ0663806.1 hypothetical protein HanLR1_Chr13g0485161 [Helianthus annuus]KAJ0671292.1 hypothetical protein HanOQP8_Chr13g0483951 [Helianthus annuus]
MKATTTMNTPCTLLPKTTAPETSALALPSSVAGAATSAPDFLFFKGSGAGAGADEPNKLMGSNTLSTWYTASDPSV